MSRASSLTASGASRLAALAWIVLLTLACGGASSAYTFIEPATIEPIEGSDVSRITLTTNAAARLAVSTVEVRTELTARIRQFGAEVIVQPASVGIEGGLWLRLVLTDSERNAVDLNLPGVLRSLSGDSAADGLLAQAARGEEGEGGPSDDLFFVVTAGPEISVGTALLIELQSASGERLVVPYGSVVYDPDGRTWVYTNPDALVYERRPITIDYIDGDEAILLDGPPPGTAVVAVGAAELSGFEAGIGR